ncbi:MAG TPA: hypothetical protein VK469_15025 [Candidatus Kapabacteria bacterium]|nr:hypothetical protein [Candidatus Kapabacteria bacterium]
MKILLFYVYFINRDVKNLVKQIIIVIYHAPLVLSQVPIDARSKKTM